jgi:hypothetical protein
MELTLSTCLFVFDFKEIREDRSSSSLARRMHSLTLEIAWCETPLETGLNELQGHYPSYLLVLRRKALSGGVARYRSTPSWLFELPSGSEGGDEYIGSIF